MLASKTRSSSSNSESSWSRPELLKFVLNFKRPNLIGVHAPVAPDLAKTVKMRSEHSENLTSVFNGAKNGQLSFKTLHIYQNFVKLMNFFLYFFTVLEKQLTLSRESRKTPRCANSGATGAWELNWALNFTLHKRATYKIQSLRCLMKIVIIDRVYIKYYIFGIFISGMGDE